MQTHGLFLMTSSDVGRANPSSLATFYQPGLFFLPACLMVSSFVLSPCFWRVLLCCRYLCLSPSSPTSEPSFCHLLMGSKDQWLSRTPPGPDCDCWKIQPHRWSRHWALSLFSVKISMAGLLKPQLNQSNKSPFNINSYNRFCSSRDFEYRSDIFFLSQPMPCKEKRKYFPGK